MSASLFVDTNILVYAVDRSDIAKSERADCVIDGISASGTGAISGQVVGEFIWATTRKLSARIDGSSALRLASEFSAAFTLLPITDAVTREALRITRRYGMQYWDAQIWATARVGGCEVIVSEDAPMSELEGIIYVDPFGDENLAQIIREPSSAYLLHR
ncbi:MAG: PIN domain-containing protein [Actinomycetota bacterium]|nr:PIN domain-containing protein [Actinomycetota bacterium]